MNPLKPKEFKILKREIPYQGVFRIARYHLQYQLFEGGWSNTITREVLERQSAACVLPYDPILDRVVLIEQFRAGALNQMTVQNPWIIEIVAGIFDHNESPEQIAIREAKEEAACPILDLCLIYDYFVSPGGSNEYCHLFCGRIDASTIDKEGIYGLPEENENIRAFTLSTKEAYTLLTENKIKTAPAIIALQWLQLNREWLKKLWQIK